MSLAWDVAGGHGLLGGAEDILVALAVSEGGRNVEEGGGDGGDDQSLLTAVRTRKIVNPGLGAVRQERI